MTVRTLMYHSISGRGPGGFEARYVLSPRVFRGHLNVLRALRMPVLPLEAIVDNRAQRGVILTFDDAYADFGSTAWPVLREYGYPAAVMVPTSYVGDLDRWAVLDGGSPRPLLAWGELRQLLGEGATIGSHSATHADLQASPLETVEKELTESRDRLTHELGEPCRFLAYPYNRTGPSVMGIAERVGYVAALGGRQVTNSRFDRRRYNVGGADVLSFTTEVLGLVDAARAVKRTVDKSRARLPRAA